MRIYTAYYIQRCFKKTKLRTNELRLHGRWSARSTMHYINVNIKYKERERPRCRTRTLAWPPCDGKCRQRKEAQGDIKMAAKVANSKEIIAQGTAATGVHDAQGTAVTGVHDVD